MYKRKNVGMDFLFLENFVVNVFKKFIGFFDLLIINKYIFLVIFLGRKLSMVIDFKWKYFLS